MFDLFGNLYTKKTEPLAIPYMGSKRKYADELINRMLEIKPGAKYFYDLCGGGGAMSFAALQKGMTVFYNEIYTDMVDFMCFVFDCIEQPRSDFGLFPEDYYQFVTREKFFELKNQSGVYPQFVRICYSFGNNQRGYLFSPELEKIKELLHNVVVYKCEKSLEKANNELCVSLKMPIEESWNKRRLNIRLQLTKKRKRFDLEQLERLQRLEQLEQLQQLQQLEQLEQLERVSSKITFTNLSYDEVLIATPIEETIVYLDPPYRKTEKYLAEVNHNHLDSWFEKLPYVAFMSEYNAPFECVHEIKTRSSYNTNNSKKTIEKLYVNKTADFNAMEVEK